jgi:thymidylate synthase (FAD)
MSEKTEEKLVAKLVSQYVKLADENKSEEELINLAGSAAGVCFKAEDTYEANLNRLLGCIKRGHTSVLEHATISFEVRTDRGTSHALVRHRHCAFTQESTIYTKYTRFSELSFIELPMYDKYKEFTYPTGYNEELLVYCQEATDHYTALLAEGLPAGIARDVLPNCTATLLKITTNFRELQAILKIRKQAADSIRMHQMIAMLEAELKVKYPTLTRAILEA